MLTKKAVRYLLVSFAIIIGFTTITQAQAGAPRSQAPSRIVSAIDDSVRVTVKGSAPAFAKTGIDLGQLDGATSMPRMILVLGASPDQEYQARTLLDSMHTTGSPDYHHWLTPEEFGQKFGPSAQDLAQVTGWLKQHGFSVDSVAKSGRWIEFSGTSAQVEAAFQTQMRQYFVAGEAHIANANDISVPAALSPVVKGVASLHNFFSKPMHRRYNPNANVPFGNQQVHAIAPADLAKIYDLGPLYTANLNGATQTIAIVAVSNINTSDVATFQSVFGLAANTPNIILNGPDPGVNPGSAGFEATLDAEWSAAVARGATIDVVVSGGSLTTDPVLLGSTFIVDQNLAAVMNVSFGLCESILDNNPVDGNSFWAAIWEQAAAQGISVFVSSGDTGAAGCDASGETLTAATQGTAISGFASTPFNTAVGGTEFNESLGLDSTFWTETPNLLASANGYIPEMAWNDSCTPTTPNSVCPQLPAANGQFLLLATGGGLSNGVYATPSYQTIGGIPGLSATVLKGNRGIPDISLDAAVQHDPYIVCFTPPGSSPDCQLPIGPNTFPNLAGGTSFASPEFAGIMAIVDQKLGSRQGLANYVLYPLAAAANLSGCNSNNRTVPSTGTACVFNDTTVGTNGVPGNDTTTNPTAGSLGFPSTPGYDLVTGLGSVDANNFVNAWAGVHFSGSQTTLASSTGASINITHGTSVTFTVTVQKSGGGAGPTGNAAVVTSEAAPKGGTFAVGAGILAAGTFSLPFKTLPGGTYNVTAHYPGDGTFAASDSNIIAATVAPEGTITVLQPLILNLNNGTIVRGTTVAYGDGVNILGVDADIAGQSGLLPSSGPVTFTINGTPITPFAIDNSGIGEFLDCFFPQSTCLTPGTYTFSAIYNGDGISYGPSGASNTVTITVIKGNPSVSLSVIPTQVTGTPFLVSASVVTPPLGTIVPTGTVQFFDGTTALGSPVTVNGTGGAAMNVTLNTGGNHSITAQYFGDTTYNQATSPATVVNVGAPFNFTAASAAQTIAAGGTATYNLTLTGVGGFTGAVGLACTGAPGGATCAVNPSTANLSAANSTTAVTVTVSNTANARLTPTLFRQVPFAFAGVLGAMFLGAGFGLWRKPRQRLLALFTLLIIAGLCSCGGGSPKPPTNATLTVTATNSGVSSTITLSLTVTH